MQVQLTFRQMNPTFELEAQIFREAEKLDHACPQQLRWCHVVIEQPHRHRQEGRPYRVRVAVDGDLGYFVASSESGHDAAHENPHIAISDTFGAVRRQLLEKAHAHQDGHSQGHWPTDQEALL